MGSVVRFAEDEIERQLVGQKSKGVIRPEAELDWDVPADGDVRGGVPVMGLREYWYPALPVSKVGRKPLYWTMLGDDMVFFRNREGQVVAMTDVCPHRGASLSEGSCFYRGFVTCPYHGATFDGRGECTAFITEGPDSPMVGQLRAKVYPTQVHAGWVFVWMGEGEPAPIEEDLPPELFDPECLPLSSYTYWHTNWVLAIENHSDSHNALFVHRDSIKQLLGLTKGRNRSPVGARGKVVNNRALIALYEGQDYYAKDGKVPHQMYYPGVDGVWPLHRWRLLWQWFFERFAKRARYDRVPEEWKLGHHLPCMVRTGGNNTRYAVAVKHDLSRIVYFYFAWPGNGWRRLLKRLQFKFVQMPLEYNFSNQDNGAASPCRYWTPEYLSATDGQVVRLRKLIAHESRDAQRRKEQALQEPATVMQAASRPRA